MIDVPRTEVGWPKLYRWGPYALLALGALVSAGTAQTLMSTREVAAAGALTVAALGWQVSWDRRLRELPEQSRGRIGYFAVRTILAFGLSWLNPFFSIYAVMGYFDAARHLPRSGRRWGLLAIAATLASSQASVPDGPMPANGLQLGVFAALFTLHASLALILDRFSDREARQRREQQATIEELASANERLEQVLRENETLHAQLLVQAREAGRADERHRLAAEIHDTLAQGLAGIVTQLQASTECGDADSAAAHVDRAANLARYSLDEARRSVHNLTPGPLTHRTLPEALKEATTRWAETSTASPELTVTGTFEPLNKEVEAALLRATEEALGNAAKHADAERVVVTLSYFDDEVVLDVRDDGRGCDPTRSSRSSSGTGFGLDGMRMRSASVGGSLEFESEPGGGTAVSVRVPLVRDES